MHQLLILRHAKSSWDDTSLPDRDRPLSGRGRRAIAAIRDVMRELGLVPDLILLSPSRRTRETLAGLEPWDETPLVEPMEMLYLANADQLVAVLRDVPETVRSVLLLGHNPGLHDLAVRLAGDAGGEAAQRLAKGLPTAALVELAVAAPWRQLAAGGGRPVRYIVPSDLLRSD